jgi:hypothetical protein
VLRRKCDKSLRQLIMRPPVRGHEDARGSAAGGKEPVSFTFQRSAQSIAHFAAMAATDACFGPAAGEFIATSAATITIKKTNVSFFAMFASSRSEDNSTQQCEKVRDPHHASERRFRESVKT